jgi:hypothetical protein
MKKRMKKRKRLCLVILCFICIGIITAICINRFKSNDKKSHNKENGARNSRTVLYNDSIYFIKNRKLYKADVDGTNQKVLKKLPYGQRVQEGDEYSNLTIYKNRLYAIYQASDFLDRDSYIFSIALDGTGYRKEVEGPNLKGDKAEEYNTYIIQFSITNGYIYYACIFYDYEENSHLKYTIYKQKIGMKKKIKTKYERKDAPELFEKYAYYIEYNDKSRTSKLIRMDVETGKEVVCYTGKRPNVMFGYISYQTILKKRLILSSNTDIIWINSKNTKEFVKKKVATNTEYGVSIVNVNNKEVFYSVGDCIFKLDLKTRETEAVFFWIDIDVEPRTNTRMESVELLGDTMAIYGYLNGDERNEFIVFVQRKEGMESNDYARVIREKIQECQ